MPISWHARWMRSAISPRLAIRSFSMAMRCGSADGEQRLVELDRLAVLDMHGLQRARRGGGDRVHHLHRLDDQDRVGGLHRRADRSEEHTSELQSLMRHSYAAFFLA